MYKNLRSNFLDCGKGGTYTGAGFKILQKRGELFWIELKAQNNLAFETLALPNEIFHLGLVF